MNWLSQLFLNPDSIGHIVLTYAFVIALGTYLGRIKVLGVSFGVTCVLFVALLINYAGIRVNPTVLSFLRDFGLIFFVYLMGLQVGPSFFNSFKHEGVHLNVLTVVSVLVSIAVTIALFFMLGGTITLPQILGVHFGAVTNTPGLGATQEALDVMGYQGESIAVAYACAYPLGVVATILSLIALRYLFSVDLKEEDKRLLDEESAANTAPIYFQLELQNSRLEGITIHEARRLVGRSFICSRVLHEGTISSPTGNSVLHVGDIMRLVSEPDDKEALLAFFGRETPDVDLANDKHSPVCSALIRVTQESVNGTRVRDLHLSRLDGVNITRVYRNGIQLFPHKALRLQLGDKVYCVGPERSIARLASLLGNQLQKLDHPNIIVIFLGILLGVLIGSVPLAIPGIPVPLKLGLAGGPLIVAILLGHYGPRIKLVTYTTYSVNLMLREIGIAIFLASVGLSAGENFVNALLHGNGPLYVLLGLAVTVIPCLVTGAFARLRYQMNFHHIMGMLAGANTNVPALAYAGMQSETNAALVAYSTVYPLALFLRILTGQLILVALWSFV
ncbi:MAG: putative transporter [Sutterella sp.]|nr:putative transporter [Sutterella sp.]MDD7427928.1 putative transporter [Sutterella sp.]MDY3272878.1 putative transporter [Duodenibacillus sp.]